MGGPQGAGVTASFSLEGRSALVAGGGGGIGSAVAVALADAGTSVTVLARTPEPLQVVAERIAAAGGSARVAVADVTDPDSVAAALDPIPAHDIVVNAAGINRPRPFVDVEIANFDELFAVNVRGTFIVTQHQVRRLLMEGRAGVVINVSSQMGHVGAPNRVVYCGAKHAVEGMTKAMAVELGSKGIRVVAVAPTWIETAFTASSFSQPGFREQVLKELPIGRIGTPDDVAAAIVFLASDAASLITGTSLLVDGGWTAH